MNKHRRFTSIPLLCVVLAFLVAGTAGAAFLDRPAGRESELDARERAPAGDAAAEVSGDEAPEVVSNAASAVAESGETTGAIDPLFAGDVLVADEDPTVEGHPDMACTDSGRCYLTFEGMNDFCVYVYRSLNGGLSWSPMLSSCGGAGDMHDPSIAVPEVTEDYLYWVYEHEELNRIRLVRYDLNTGEWLEFTVASNALGVRRPRIVTDNREYGDYYLYVTYISGTLLATGDDVAPQDAYQVMVARSTDKGATWTNQTSLFIPDFADPQPRPDIAYGGGTVYVTWDEEVLGPSTERNVHLARSTNFGASWGADVDLTAGSSQSCFDPRVAAIQGGDEVLVAYTKDYITDLDVWYAYSTDGGGSWTTDRCLDCAVDLDEERPDLAVDASGGDFHAAYWKEYDIRYSHASSASPGAWSAREVINDTSEASLAFVLPTVAVDYASGQAGVAWSDFRTFTYAIYFDRADREHTVACSYTCEPASGTVPFSTHMTTTLTNIYSGQTRRIAGRINVTLAEGAYFANWRAGYTNVAAGASHVSAWSTAIPALGALIGENVFQLSARDVTPSPYNQPPYPPTGDTCTDTCSVTAGAP